MKKWHTLTVYLTFGVCNCFHANQTILKKTSELLLDPKNIDNTLGSYGTILGTVTLIESNPILKKTINYPNKKLMESMQKEDLFKHDSNVTLLIDADNPFKDYLAI